MRYIYRGIGNGGSDHHRISELKQGQEGVRYKSLPIVNCLSPSRGRRPNPQKGVLVQTVRT